MYCLNVNAWPDTYVLPRSVLQAIWADFLDGDFEIIRMLLRE